MPYRPVCVPDVPFLWDADRDEHRLVQKEESFFPQYPDAQSKDIQDLMSQ